MRSLADLIAELATLDVALTLSGDVLRVRGPAGAVTPALRDELAARKAELIGHLRTQAPALRGSDTPRAEAPLSFNQRRIWFLERLDSDSSAFVMAAAWQVSGALDVDALDRAVTALVARHELLRSVVSDSGEEPVLRILPPQPVHVARAPHVTDDAGVEALLAREARTPFDLTAAPPFRIRVAQRAPARHVLTLAVHHIASDHWSMGVLIRELGELYSAAATHTAPTLGALPVSFSDYTVWQRDAFGDAQLAPHLQFWQAQLRDAVTDLALPLDRARPAERGDNGALHRFALPAALAQRVHAYALRANATPYMVLLAAYALVLSRWSGQDEIMVGCPVGNRDREETRGLVGFFISTLPLRIDLRGDPDFAGIVARVRAACLAAFAHQDAPFDRIVQAVKPERTLNRAPLFQTMFVQQPAGSPALSLAGLDVEPLAMRAGAPELDLTCFIDGSEAGYHGVVEYDADLYDEAAIAEVFRQFAHVVETGVRAAPSGVPLSTFPLAPPRPAPAPCAPSAVAALPALIAAVAAAHPQRVAIESGGQQIRYGELTSRVHALAARLAHAGAARGSVIGLGLPSSVELIVAMLAVWQVGAAYVVLSPSQPAARRARMIEAAGATLAVTAAGDDGDWPIATLALDDTAGRDAVPAAPAARGWPSADALAYVCFTSGSSGTPKGVAVTHGNLRNHARAVMREFGLDGDDRVLQFAAPDFDVVAEEIFPTLAAGACVVVRPAGAIDSLEAFTEFAADARLSVLNLPAAFWHEWVRMLDQAGRAPHASLRLLVTGSDRVFTHRLAQWQRLCRHPVGFRSGYGPTEATISAAFFDPARDPVPAAAETLPLGHAIDNVQLRVVDPAGHEVPAGVIGELVVSGAGVAQGYLDRTNRIDATTGFRPQAGAPGERCYWTGDLGRTRADGTLEFLGRNDHQIKIRGFRIEPAEIEAALSAHPQVREAAVRLQPDAGGTPRLVAIVAGDVDAVALQAWLGERLPAYMVPGAFAVVPALPRTASGKVDPHALAAIETLRHEAADAPAATAAEAALARLFADVLGVPSVSAIDNIFGLGIDSIRSLQIVSRARQLGWRLTVRDVFRFQTIRQLAQAVDAQTPLLADATAPAEQEEGDAPLSPIQAWFFEQIHEGAQHYNQAVVLHARQEIDAAVLARALDAVVARHEMLRIRVRDGRVDVVDRPAAGMLAVIDADASLDAAAPGNGEHLRDLAYALAQESMRVDEGRVVQAVLVRPGGRLMIAVHHLAVDTYSWSILLDDLARAYAQAARGEAIALAPASTPYRGWSRRLAGLAATAEAAAHARHLAERHGGHGHTVLPPATSAGAVSGAATRAFTLTEQTTAALLHAVPKAFGTRIDETLVAALARAAGRAGIAEPMHVDLERNGRADLFEHVDLSRTVGWFTAVQPVTIDRFREQPVAALLKAVGAAVREAPYDGLGMGVLRYLSPDPAVRASLAALPHAEILVNYLGRMDGAPADGGLFAVTDEPTGRTVSPAVARSHVIELNAGLWGGCLRAELSFPDSAEHRATIDRWLDGIVAVLDEFAALALAADAEAPQAAQLAGEHLPAALPLTPLQQGILFHSLRDPSPYFDQLCITLDGALDVAAFRAAWHRALARHEILRTSFHWHDTSTPLQRVHADAVLPWQLEDWRGIAPDAHPAALHALMQRDRDAGFDLAQAPLMRMHLIRTGDARHTLVWSAHHLLLDGWSVSILMGEIFALYREARGDLSSRLPDAPPFTAYVRWHEAQRREHGDAGVAFWRRTLQGIDAPTSLAFLRQAHDPHAAAGSVALARRLSTETTAALRALAQRARATLGTLMQAAWGLLLARHSGTRDVLFGVTVSGRPAELDGMERMVGMLIATVPARIAIPADLPLAAWLHALQEQHLEREQYAYIPLTEIKRASEMPPDAELFQSLLLVQNYPGADTLQAAGLRIADVATHENTHYPLTLSCTTGDTLELQLHRDSETVAERAAQRLLDQLCALLDAMAAQPERPAGHFVSLEGEPAAQALAAGRGRDEAIAPAFLPAHIDALAREHPDALALADQQRRLSYAELSRASQRIARRLRERGVGGEARVAVSLPRSLDYVVHVIAILRCGAAFVPVDPAYPAARKRFILEDSRPMLLIAAGADDAELADLAIRTVTPDALAPQPDDAEDAQPWPACHPDAAAYIIYTSGSTGTPKGVTNTHSGLRSLAHAQRGLFGLGRGDRVLQFASASFDASVWEISMAFGAGAALLVPQAGTARPGPDLQAFIAQQRVTAATLPPTALSTLDGERLPDLQVLVVAGEACAPALAVRWAEGRRFFNAYGPSEATVAASIEAGARSAELLPIGRPLPNVQMHVLDDDLQPVPPGVTGELYIGGAGLARGYLDRPRLTAERFLPDPHGAPGARLYKTGDRAYRLADGRVQFVGRIDHQIKLRGFRIELTEIEAVLARHPEVAHAAVLVREHAENDRRLVAFIETAAPIGSHALRAFLVERLPAHMVPAYFVELPALPLTTSGKIDRRALERHAPADVAPAAADRGDAPEASSAAATEAILCGIWARVLGCADVRPEQNFFELGGDSILAIQVVSKANQQGIAITLNQLMDPASQTVAALAALADAASGSARAAQPAEAPEEAAATAGPVPLTPIQRWFLDQNPPDVHHYNQSFLLEVPADLNAHHLTVALNAVQARHDALRLRFVRDAAGWHQTLTDGEPLAVVVETVPPDLTEDGWRTELEAAAARRQRELDIGRGPTIKVVLHRPATRAGTGRLHIVVHHLAIDAVSWRILLDDLFTAYAQQQASGTIRLPRAGTSFSRWAHALVQHVASGAASGALRGWLDRPADTAHLPVLRHGVASTVADAQTLGVELDERATGALLRDVPRRYGSPIQETVLAALAAALADGHAGGGHIAVDVESHGRDRDEAGLAGFDVSRTVGWFTVLAPLMLPLVDASVDAQADAIRAVHAAAQAMPGRGFSFGALRFLSEDPAIRDALAALPPAPIVFNYLGQWDTSWPDALAVRPARERDGDGFAPTTPRAYLLEVNAMIADGRLRLDLSFDPRQLDAGWARRLGDAMLGWLERVASHGAEEGDAGVVPAPDAAGGQAPAASFALGPQQASMWSHAQAHPASRAYVVQFSAHLPRELDADAFVAAWQTVLRRHAALGAYFVADASGAPRQTLADPCDAPWLREDWASRPPSETDAAFRDRCDEARRQGFDLTAAPLMRFLLVRAADGYRFAWTYHHLLVDGWSMPILIGEVIAAYDGRLTARSAAAPDYRDFLHWLEQRDLSAAHAFWARELAGLPASRWPAADGAACSGDLAERTVRLPARVNAALAAFARGKRLSVPSVLLQGWATLLAHRTGTRDVCFGVTTALRPTDVAGIETMVGPLIGTYPLRHAVDPAEPFAAACLRLQRRRMAATEHAGLPLDAIAQAAAVPAADDLFGTAVRIQNYPTGDRQGGHATLRLDAVEIKDYWHFPFNLEVALGEEITLIAVYDAGRVDAAVAEALLADYARLLESVAEAPPAGPLANGAPAHGTGAGHD